MHSSIFLLMETFFFWHLAALKLNLIHYFITTLLSSYFTVFKMNKLRSRPTFSILRHNYHFILLYFFPRLWNAFLHYLLFQDRKTSLSTSQFHGCFLLYQKHVSKGLYWTGWTTVFWSSKKHSLIIWSSRQHLRQHPYTMT